MPGSPARWFYTTEVYCHTVLERRSLRPRCQAWFLLRPAREGSIRGFSGFVDGRLLLVPSCGLLPESVSKVPFLMRTVSYWIRAHPYDLSLT